MKHNPRTFVVPGKPVGYYAIGKSPNYKRMQQYHDYNASVRWAAIRAGIKLPLFADRDNHLSVITEAFFPNRTHCDPGNVQKGICDALFYARGKKKGNDKYTGGMFSSPKYDKENPRVEVLIINDFEVFIETLMMSI